MIPWGFPEIKISKPAGAGVIAFCEWTMGPSTIKATIIATNFLMTGQV
jgi:hypothetical protein